MKLLAIGAHPDDLEIYMFGTLAAARARGDELLLAIATDGAAGGAEPGPALSARRRSEAAAAAALLDAEPHRLEFPDGTLVADAALVDALRRLIAGFRPDLILTHAGNDYHGDHRALATATALAANFVAPVAAVDTMMGVGFLPTHLVDIGPHMDLKRQAILCHASQDPARFVAMAERQNGFRAAQAGVPEGFAEAFRFEPIYPFADIRDLLPPPPRAVPVRDRSAPKG